MPEKIKKIFMKEYLGKKVPSKYKNKYGKIYQKKEVENIFYSWLNKKKNKKGSIGLAILSALAVFIIGFTITNLLMPEVTNFRIDLNCAYPDQIHDGNKLLCLIGDASIPIYIWAIISLGIGAIVWRFNL